MNTLLANISFLLMLVNNLCRLCKVELNKENQCNGHFIPEFLYKKPSIIHEESCGVKEIYSLDYRAKKPYKKK